MRRSWRVTDILVLIAVVSFALAASGINAAIDVVALSLAFGFGAFLVGSRGLGAP